MKTEKQVRVGIGVIITNDQGQVLLGKRRNLCGAGTWAPPGGKMEFGETPFETAARELKEETAMELITAEQTVVTNDIFKENNTHYITLFFEGKAKGQPIVTEPEKCETWQWFDWNQLPQELFLPFKLFLNQKNQTA